MYLEMDSHETACVGCNSLKSELSSAKEMFAKNFGQLKEKIISTHILIEKYKEQKKQLNLKCKRLEEATSLIAKLQNKVKSSDDQLKDALLNSEIIKKQNDLIAAENKTLSDNLEANLLASEKTKEQYEAILSNHVNSDVSKNKVSMETVLNREKKMLEKLNKSKDDANNLKETLKEARSQCLKLKKINKAVINHFIKFGNLLQSHNLLNKLNSKLLLKYSSNEDQDNLSSSDSNDSDLDEAGLTIEAQLLQPTALDASVQTELLADEKSILQTRDAYSQTDPYSDISTAILTDLMEPLLRVPCKLSPLPPSPKHYRRKNNNKGSKSPEDNASSLNVSKEKCCGCCHRVVVQQEEIEVLKRASSSDVQYINESLGETVQHDCAVSNSETVVVIVLHDESNTEEMVVDGDHSYSNTKFNINDQVLCGQDKNEATAAHQPLSNFITDDLVTDLNSEVVCSDRLNTLRSTNPRLKVPFFKRGSMTTIRDETNSGLDRNSVLFTKVKFFRKSYLHLCEPLEGISVINTSDSNLKRKDGPHLESPVNIVDNVAETENEGIISHNDYQMRIGREISASRRGFLEKDSESYSSKYSASGIVNESRSIDIRLSQSKSIRGNNGCDAIIHPTAKRDSSIEDNSDSLPSTKIINVPNSTYLANKRLRPREITRQSILINGRPLLKRTCIQSNSDMRTALSTDHGDEELPKAKLQLEYTTPVPKKIRISHVKREKTLKSSSTQKVMDEEVDNEKLMYDLFGNPDEVIPENNNSTEIEKESSSHNAFSASESIVSAVPATICNEVKDEVIERLQDVYQPIWKSILSNNLFVVNQQPRRKPTKSVSNIGNIGEILCATPDSNVDLWKAIVKRVVPSSESIPLLVKKLANWIQSSTEDMIETAVSYIANLPNSKNNFEVILTKSEKKCLLLSENLKSTNFSEEFVNEARLVFTEAVMKHENGNIFGKAALCRFLITLYKETNAIEIAMVLCYDIVYNMPSSSGPLLIFVLCIWPDIVIGESAKSSCIMKSIRFLLKYDPLAIGLSEKCICAIQQFLDSEEVTEEYQVLVANLLVVMKFDCSLNLEASKSLELLARVKQWDWAKSILITEHLLPIFSPHGSHLLDDLAPQSKDLVKANYLYLLGCLGKQANTKNDKMVKTILKMVHSLISNSKESFCVQETAALVSVMLMSHDYAVAFRTINKWLPSNISKISQTFKLLLNKFKLIGANE